MSFKKIKGQDRATTFLKSSIENNKVSHAYIFLGRRGIGKKLTALNFAKALNCLEPVSGDPCDKCAQCRKIDESNHPDVSLVRSDKEGGSIGIDKMRAVINNIGLKPYEGKRKVYIIDGAESMTQETANALLKTLEEPPTASIIILIVEDSSVLFRTIVSRSQIVRFFPLAADDIRDVLGKVYSVGVKEARILSHISSGSLGEALKFKDEDFFDKRAALIEGLSNKEFFDSDFKDVSKEDFRLYLDIMLTLYRDILASKAGAAESELINIDSKDYIAREAGALTFEHIDEIIKQVISTQSFLDQNANPKLAMSVLGLKIQDIN